eukprot:1783805-Rhodomonas_salina.1
MRRRRKQARVLQAQHHRQWRTMDKRAERICPPSSHPQWCLRSWQGKMIKAEDNFMVLRNQRQSVTASSFQSEDRFSIS